MPRVLILGSEGFIGSSLVSYLEDKGYNVLGCVEDIRNKEWIAPYFKNAEFVIHAAGETQKINNKDACYTTNVLGTRNIIELCIENNCKLIHLSSTARKTAYGQSKQESQKEVEDAAKKGLIVIILRLCPVVTLGNPLMVWGRRYPLEYLIKDIEAIIRTHNFNKYELIDYKKFKRHEESPHLH